MSILIKDMFGRAEMGLSCREQSFLQAFLLQLSRIYKEFKKNTRKSIGVGKNYNFVIRYYNMNWFLFPFLLLRVFIRVTVTIKRNIISYIPYVYKREKIFLV